MATEAISTASAAKSAPTDDAWQKTAKSTLLNMSTSDADILKYINAEIGGENVSVARQQSITYLLGMRNQIATMLSNVLRTITDGGNQIIRNIRA